MSFKPAISIKKGDKLYTSTDGKFTSCNVVKDVKYLQENLVLVNDGFYFLPDLNIGINRKYLRDVGVISYKNLYVTEEKVIYRTKNFKTLNQIVSTDDLVCIKHSIHRTDLAIEEKQKEIQAYNSKIEEIQKSIISLSQYKDQLFQKEVDSVALDQFREYKKSN